MAEDQRNSPLLRSRRHSPELGQLHFTVLLCGALRQLEVWVKDEALALLLALGGFPFLVYLRRCQAKQMFFEKVKGIKGKNTGKVDMWYSFLRKINCLSHTEVLWWVALFWEPKVDLGEEE